MKITFYRVFCAWLQSPCFVLQFEYGTSICTLAKRLQQTTVTTNEFFDHRGIRYNRVWLRIGRIFNFMYSLCADCGFICFLSFRIMCYAVIFLDTWVLGMTAV